MKKNILLFMLPLFIVTCGQFPTRYDRIEADKLRSIGFTVDPQAEGAPGDTMHIRAFFGGQPVSAVSWQFSYDHIMSIYGTDTILNKKPLAAFAVSDRLPDSIDLSFVIPDSTFFLTKAISPATLDMVRPLLPAGMRSMTQQDFATFLADFGSIDLNDMTALGGFAGRWSSAMGISAVTPSALDSAMGIVGALVQLFSIKGELFATATSTLGHKLMIKGSITIRYNSRLKGTALAQMFPVNRNPALRWIGVYKVNDSGRKQSIFGEGPTLTSKDSLTYLYNEFMPWKVRDTVLIEKGFSYYLAADSGIAAFSMKAGDSMLTSGGKRIFAADTTVICDTVLDSRFVRYDSTGGAVVDTETYTYDWQYQNLALDSVSQPLDSLFVIAGAGEYGGQPPVMQFLPSLDRKMTRVRIWVTVSDNLFGEMNRPVGQTTRTVDLFFKYAK